MTWLQACARLGPVTCAHCGAVVPRRMVWQRYCSPACQKRAYRDAPGVRAMINAGVRRRRVLALGRACRWCGRTDAQAPWTQQRDECCRCQRARLRRPCATCGGPTLLVDRRPYCTLCLGPVPRTCSVCAAPTRAAYRTTCPRHRLARRGFTCRSPK